MNLQNIVFPSDREIFEGDTHEEFYRRRRSQEVVETIHLKVPDRRHKGQGTRKIKGLKDFNELKKVGPAKKKTITAGYPPRPSFNYPSPSHPAILVILV